MTLNTPALTQTRAISEMYRLFEKWIGSVQLRNPPFACNAAHMDQIRASMLQDLRYQRTREDRKAITREIRGEMILLGKIRKALLSEASQ